MLTSVEHHCQINIERISRKLVKRIINKLENLHISNIETFLPKLDDAPLEFCNRWFEFHNGICWPTNFENRINLAIILSVTISSLKNFHDYVGSSFWFIFHFNLVALLIALLHLLCTSKLWKTRINHSIEIILDDILWCSCSDSSSCIQKLFIVLDKVIEVILLKDVEERCSIVLINVIRAWYHVVEKGRPLHEGVDEVKASTSTEPGHKVWRLCLILLSNHHIDGTFFDKETFLRDFTFSKNTFVGWRGKVTETETNLLGGLDRHCTESRNILDHCPKELVNPVVIAV